MYMNVCNQLFAIHSTFRYTLIVSARHSAFRYTHPLLNIRPTCTGNVPFAAHSTVCHSFNFMLNIKTLDTCTSSPLPHMQLS